MLAPEPVLFVDRAVRMDSSNDPQVKRSQLRRRACHLMSPFCKAARQRHSVRQDFIRHPAFVIRIRAACFYTSHLRLIATSTSTHHEDSRKAELSVNRKLL